MRITSETSIMSETSITDRPGLGWYTLRLILSFSLLLASPERRIRQCKEPLSKVTKVHTEQCIHGQYGTYSTAQRTSGACTDLPTNGVHRSAYTRYILPGYTGRHIPGYYPPLPREARRRFKQGYSPLREARRRLNTGLFSPLEG